MAVRPDEPAPVTVRLPSTYFRITLYRNTVHYLATSTSECSNMLARGDVLRKASECGGLVAAVEAERRAHPPLFLGGLFALYLVTGLILTGIMRHRNMGRARLLRAQATVVLLLIFSMVVSKAILLFTSLPAIIVPALFLPVMSGYYFRRQIALAVVVVTSLAMVSMIQFDIAAFLVFTVSGLAAVLVAKRRVHRGRTMLKAGALAGWVSLLLVVVTTMVFAKTFKIHDDPAEHLDPRYSIWIASVLGGVGSGILAFVFAPLTGWLLGEVSRSRLLDLQDLNNPLLKRLQERAASTWEHSRAMANLAEAAVNAIGANPTLVRVGAYYHDVGKSNHPDYFIENQGGGANPHDELTPDESASRIFRHVTDGTKMLRQEGIPEDVVEFCYSHHGTSLLEYFWHKVMAAGNPDEFTERDFTYPGYKPTTRETGILMLVDAIEAGARTVDHPDKDAFTALVRAIVFSKLSQGQLDESGLSLADLRVVVNTLVDTLVNMYHARIKYPWQTGDTDSYTKLSSSAPPPADEEDDDADGEPPPKRATQPANVKAPFPKADDAEEGKRKKKETPVSPTAMTVIKKADDPERETPIDLRRSNETGKAKATKPVVGQTPFKERSTLQPPPGPDATGQKTVLERRPAPKSAGVGQKTVLERPAPKSAEVGQKTVLERPAPKPKLARVESNQTTLPEGPGLKLDADGKPLKPKPARKAEPTKR